MTLDSLLRDLDGANPYELLGLKVSATDAEIKEARRRLQRKAHPDLADGDGDLARVVNIAADLLLDPHRRAMFDSGAEATPDRLHAADPEPNRPVNFWDARPARPRSVTAAMWSMYLAAISCALFFVVGAVGTGLAGDSSARTGEVTEALALAALPIAVWIAITLSLGAGIRQGWRGIPRAGWALTVIVLTPIGLGCGTLMNYTLTPADTMIWAFPIGLVFALAAMVLVSLRVSRSYLETMAAIRETVDQLSRHHVGRRRRR